MFKRKTQHGNAELQDEFNFALSSSSLTTLITQAVLCGYRVDSHSIVSPIWRRNHD